MVKTLLVGNFGDKNIGDELILLSALQEYPDSVVMTSDPDFSKTFTGLDFKTVPFPPTGLRSLLGYITNRDYRCDISTLNNYDLTQVVFPGGGLFAIKFRACLLWWLVFRFLKYKVPKAKFIFTHQGVDHNLSWFSKKLIKSVFRKLDFVSVRDESSHKALAALGVKSQVVQDRVFEYLQNQNFVENSQQKTVFINVCKPIENVHIKSIRELYPHHKLKFLAFAPSDLKCLPDYFSPEIIDIKTAQGLFTALCDTEIMVGERFHSLVLGYYFCGPEKTFSIRAPYSEKVRSFMTTHKIKRFDD